MFGAETAGAGFKARVMGNGPGVFAHARGLIDCGLETHSDLRLRDALRASSLG